ncbi:MAG: TonB-dependent receptor [Prevotellaceae bacterium]|nr:TonB-dependent receptor [Prevotellaceae bacterium]
MYSGKDNGLRVRRGLCVVAVKLAAVAGLFAQTPVDTAKVYRIHEVVVVGQRPATEVIPVQTLSGTALEGLSVHSVADALRYFSGVQLKDYGGIGGLKTVNVRSLGSNHVGVFYDGIAIGNAQNGQVDMGRFSLDNIEAISLYNGQKSAVLQPARDFASASAIYMRTRKPVFGDGEHNHVRLTYKTGSFDALNPSALWEQKWSDYLSSSVNVEQLYTSGKYKFRSTKKDGYDTTEVRQNGDVTMWRAEAALFGRLREGEWRAKAYYYRSERGVPGAAVREEAGVFVHADRQWDDNFFVQGSFRKSFSPLYSLLLNGKYAYDYLHYLSDPRLDVTTMYIENQYWQQEAYFSSAHEFAFFDFWKAALASDVQFNTLDADLKNFVYPTRYLLLTSAATSLHFSKFHVQASLLHTYVHDITRVVSATAGDKSVFTPSLAVSYQPLKELLVRAFYKRIFRLPTFNDLYYEEIGNKLLDPEYTTQYNVGVTYSHAFDNGLLRQLDMQVDAYYNEVEDKIVAMPTDNQFRWTMINLGYVEIRGVDAAMHGWWQAAGVRFDTRLTYTYQRAQDFTNPDSDWYGGQIPYIPWHSGSAVVGGSYKKWRLNYSFIYTGERYESRANILENYALSWYTHDMAVTREFQLGTARLQLTAEINNLLGQAYEVVQWYPMPGRNYKLIIKVEL